MGLNVDNSNQAQMGSVTPQEAPAKAPQASSTVIGKVKMLAAKFNNIGKGAEQVAKTGQEALKNAAPTSESPKFTASAKLGAKEAETAAKTSQAVIQQTPDRRASISVAPPPPPEEETSQDVKTDRRASISVAPPPPEDDMQLEEAPPSLSSASSSASSSSSSPTSSARSSQNTEAPPKLSTISQSAGKETAKTGSAGIQDTTKMEDPVVAASKKNAQALFDTTGTLTVNLNKLENTFEQTIKGLPEAKDNSPAEFEMTKKKALEKYDKLAQEFNKIDPGNTKEQRAFIKNLMNSSSVPKPLALWISNQLFFKLKSNSGEKTKETVTKDGGVGNLSFVHKKKIEQRNTKNTALNKEITNEMRKEVIKKQSSPSPSLAQAKEKLINATFAKMPTDANSTAYTANRLADFTGNNLDKINSWTTYMSSNDTTGFDEAFALATNANPILGVIDKLKTAQSNLSSAEGKGASAQTIDQLKKEVIALKSQFTDLHRSMSGLLSNSSISAPLNNLFIGETKLNYKEFQGIVEKTRRGIEAEAPKKKTDS